MRTRFTPRRVLLVANFDRRRLHAAYYNVDNKFHAALLRAGHHVIAFSDRDVAREGSLLQFSSRIGGVSIMRRRLIKTAQHYQPDLILFGHVDLINAGTIRALREGVPGSRLAQFNVDAIFSARAMEGFASRTTEVDISFMTTADVSDLALPPSRRSPIHFFPNPVDASIETARVFEIPRQSLPYDGQFLGTPFGPRDDQISDLISRLPFEYRFRFGGGVLGSRRLRSVEFLDTLAQAACAPNFVHEDGKSTPLLYSSDRIAQLLGQGVAVLSAASAKLQMIYDDGIMEYEGREHLASRMIDLWRDDDARRRLAECGWRIAHEKTAGHRVAQYLVVAALEEPFSENYGWPVKPIA